MQRDGVGQEISLACGNQTTGFNDRQKRLKEPEKEKKAFHVAKGLRPVTFCETCREDPGLLGNPL